MNKSNQSISLILAAGSAGAAAFSLANSALLAALPAEVILGAGASLAILGLAIYDYTRRARSLAVPVRLLRPNLPTTATCSCSNNDSGKNRLAA